jgi:hypothetical protein
MSRPVTPDAVQREGSTSRAPWEYEGELAKLEAIREFMKSCGELSDVTDTFHHYESRWVTLNRISGLARPYRIGMYRHYKKNSLNHLRMAVNEIVRLLSQPKIIIHGSDTFRDDFKEPGFIENMKNGAKKILGMKTDEPRPQSEGVNNARY